MVRLSDNFEDMQPKKYAGALSRPLPSQISSDEETDDNGPKGEESLSETVYFTSLVK